MVFIRCAGGGRLASSRHSMDGRRTSWVLSVGGQWLAGGCSLGVCKASRNEHPPVKHIHIVSAISVIHYFIGENDVLMETAGTRAVQTTRGIVDLNFTARRFHIAGAEIEKLIKWLLACTNVRHIDYSCLRRALESGYGDLEDSAQIACAEYEECDVFLTSDKSLLSRDLSPILVLTPEQFLDKMR